MTRFPGWYLRRQPGSSTVTDGIEPSGDRAQAVETFSEGAYDGAATLPSVGAWRIGGGPTAVLPEPARRISGARSTDDPALEQALRELRAGGGADEAFAVLDARMRPRLLAYFRADFRSRADAEDLAQRTLARVAAGIGRLRSEESFMAWLFTIARNVRRTAHERQRRGALVVAGSLDAAGDPPDPRPTALESGLAGERIAALRAAIEALPAQQRQCFLLRVDRELSYEAVAETLALSVHTVRNHLALARRTLRRALEPQRREDRSP